MLTARCARRGQKTRENTGIVVGGMAILELFLPFAKGINLPFILSVMN